jgi:hypothetical protein
MVQGAARRHRQLVVALGGYSCLCSALLLSALRANAFVHVLACNCLFQPMDGSG